LLLFKDERSRAAIDVAERFADGLADYDEFDRSNVLAHEVPGYGEDQAVWAACCVVCDDMDLAVGGADVVAPAEQCSVLRELFGNPFRPVSFVPTWRAPTVVALAQGMYDDRRFDDMPLLADALEEAGCTEEAILKHCREPGEHVRGCWVVDLILDKN
jgi:hypothetical protein